MLAAGSETTLMQEANTRTLTDEEMGIVAGGISVTIPATTIRIERRIRLFDNVFLTIA